MIFHVTLEQAEDGWVVVECPALPGCVSEGRDEKEALDNIREAITVWLWAEDQKAIDIFTSSHVLKNTTKHEKVNCRGGVTPPLRGLFI
ncbi:type II toxin-antitoxin system HicB family antitoxin [Desulfobacca acetoxidans]